MKTTIKTDIKDKIFQASREFDADVTVVWKAFTDPDILDQWWAPEPWRCETKSMEFKAGGKWVYDMIGPDGERHGGLQLFDEIKENEFFSGIDAFSDDNGHVNEDLPVAKWKNIFTPTEKGTLVTTIAQYPDKESLETVLEMGMSEGLTQAQNQLEIILMKLK